VLTWRATANGLEAVAAQHSDRLLILDELSQVDPKEAGEIAYMLSNERGKSRARRDGLARQPATWRLLFVSSGEVGLADKLSEIGKKAKAGQEVRLVDVPADAGRGLGLFEDVHGSEGAEAFAGRLKLAAVRYHGSVAVEYLEELAGKLAIDADGLRARIVSTVEEFLAIHAPKDSSGQALSVARRFGLIAAGGQIATGCGLTGWADDAAFEAAGACYQAWLDRRGGAGEQETAAAISQVRAFLEAHGDARFADLENRGGRVVPNRAGWRRVRGDATEYLIPPETWRAEICKGHDPNRVARALADASWLSRGEGDRLQTKIYIPGVGKIRLYVVRGSILGGDHGE
jgi:putative DNA primase/helicase